MLSSSKEALEALHDLNIILNPQKEVATVSNILENVHQIEIKVNYSQKNLEEKLKEKEVELRTLQTHEKKVESDQRFIAQVEEEENFKFLIAKELNALEDDCQNLEKDYKSIFSQLKLLEELEELKVKIDAEKEEAIYNKTYKDEGDNQVELSGTTERLERLNFRDVLSSVTSLLSKLSLHDQLKEEHQKLSKVKSNLTSQEILNELSHLKKLKKASCSMMLYSQICGLRRLKQEGDLLYCKFLDGFEKTIDLKRYSDFFITSRLWEEM
jgi:hypothetical protein